MRNAETSAHPAHSRRNPAETARVIRIILPNGNPITRLGDEFGAIYEDADFAELFSKLGQPLLPDGWHW